MDRANVGSQAFPVTLPLGTLGAVGVEPKAPPFDRGGLPAGRGFSSLPARKERSPWPHFHPAHLVGATPARRLSGVHLCVARRRPRIRSGARRATARGS